MTLMQYFSFFTGHVSTSFYKSVCCWYSVELPQLVEAIQLSTNNICYVVGNSFELPQLDAIQPSTNNICFYKKK